MKRIGHVLIYIFLTIILLGMTGCLNGENLLGEPTPSTEAMPTQAVRIDVDDSKPVQIPVETTEITPEPTREVYEKTEDTPAPVPTQVPDNRVILTFAGDVCLSSNYFPYITYSSVGYNAAECILPGYLTEMKNSDLCFVNSEFPFTDATKKLGGKLYNFKADPATIQMYKDLGIDIAGLANNHVYDYGEESLLDTMETLKKAGISYVGAGRNIKEAEEPIYFDVKGIRVAYVMASKAEKNRKTPEATDSSAGILLCYDSDRFLKALKKAKENADYVVAIVHWGKENSSALEPDQYELASTYIDAGADIVVGGHSHVIQGVDYYKGKPVFYSLGDFWFDYYTEDTMLLKVCLEKSDDGTVKSEARIIPGVQKEGVTAPAEDENTKSRILKQLCKLSDSAIIDPEGYVHEKKYYDGSIESLYPASYVVDFYMPDNTKYQMVDAPVGGVVELGNYYINGSEKEKIKWYVLDKQENELTLISKDILDEQSFDDENRDVNWNDSSLRKWLNDDFVKSAFTSTERDMLVKDEYGDEISVPSVSDVTNNYSFLKKCGYAAPSKYAFKKGIYTYNPIDSVIKCTDWGSSGYSEYGFGCWWLKNKGSLPGTAAFVNEYGHAVETGMYTGYYSYSDGLCGVRPIIKVRVNQ